MSAKEKKLDELEAQAAEVRKTRNTLYDYVKKQRDERDRINAAVKKLREQTQKHRTERDRINAKVQEIKQKLGPLFDELDVKNMRLADVEQKLYQEYKSRPNKDRLQKDLNRIEWEVMTTPTAQMKDREDELIDQASNLKRTLDGFENLEKQEGQKMTYLSDKKATQVEIRAFREEINALSRQSQEHHEKMIMMYEQVDSEKKKADEAHVRYIEKIEETNSVKGELDMIMTQIKALREGLKVADLEQVKQRRMSVEARQETMRQEAVRKMEAGEKLDFEDLRLIYGDEED